MIIMPASPPPSGKGFCSMSNPMIYMDHAATTPMDPEVWKAMVPYLQQSYGNPSSVYSFAREGKQALTKVREIAARLLGAKAREIYFTSGGTEAINWALKGIAWGNQRRGRHIISTAVEHHATLHALEFLEKQGFEVTLLPVDDQGFLHLEDLRDAIREDTILVSVMAANNEIGTIYPLKEIGALCRDKGVIFHTDAVQAMGVLDLNVEELKIDLLSVSAHKFHGPKGVGFLYVRGGIVIENLLHGGNQERGRRSGTENVAAIAGMGKALESLSHRKAALSRMTDLRDRMIEEILLLPGTRLNGPRGALRLPNNVNVSFQNLEGETLLMNLDLAGVMASSGSACTSGSIEESHVLKAIGVEEDFIRGSLRLTLGESTTEEEVLQVLELLRSLTARLRSLKRS